MPTILDRLFGLFGPRVVTTFAINGEENPRAEGLTARQLYATQSNLHTVISFMASNIAQLPIKLYIRDGESARRRDRDSAAAKLLYRPNADQTQAEFIEASMVEYFLMGVATWWIMPSAETPSGYELRVIPREWVQGTTKRNNYAPETLIVTAGTGGEVLEIPRREFTQFRMYSPGNPSGYQSPISALRQTLAEQIQADRFRAAIWRSSGRFNAYITRPRDVKPWDNEARQRFLTAFREGWGAGGENTGKMPLLEDGMEIKPYSFNAKEAQYVETKQLSREDVAAAYHINPALIWNTSTQTYASAKDHARALYSDGLGPTLQLFQQRINAFLLPAIGADPEEYCEFDITEKLKGNFEERAEVKQKAVGAPYMTRNEARADENLPPVEGGDVLITPLNVVEGGQANPTDTHTNQNADLPKLKTVSITRIKGAATETEAEDLAETLKRFFNRQAASILPKIGAKSAKWWDAERWDKELADDLEPVVQQIADVHGGQAARSIGAAYNYGMTRAYLRKLAEGRAHATNEATRQKLEEAIADTAEDAPTPADIMERRENTDAPTLGQSLATAISSWATIEAAKQAEDAGETRTMEKVWVTGSNPRQSHAALNGARAPIKGTFPNGAYWPGDDVLPASQTCNCNCHTDVIITEG